MDGWTNQVLVNAGQFRGAPATAPFAGMPFFDRPYAGPELVFDFGRVAERIAQVRQLERRHDCRFLMAVKSFSHPKVLAFIAARSVGFDVSNRGELAAVLAAGSTQALSLTGPALHTIFDDPPLALPAGSQVNVSTYEQYECLSNSREIELGIRINAAEGSRSGRSRFGFAADPDPDGKLAAIARDPRFTGVHLHVNNDKAGYLRKVDAALTWLARARIEVQSLNLGGGLDQFDIDELDRLIATIRGMVPASMRLHFEPGYFWFHGAGFARSRVLEVAPSYLPDAHKVTLDISRICHLQWSMPRLLQTPATDEATERVVFYGSTCLDSDIVTAAELPVASDGTPKIRAGDEVALTHVSSYSAVWNRSFNGLPAANLRLLGIDAPAPASLGHSSRKIDS